MFELSVLPADVDSQTFAVEFWRIGFAIFSHFLCILCFLHLNETLRTQTSDGFKLKLLRTLKYPQDSVPYLSLDPVEEILPDFPVRLCEFQDGFV